MLTVIDQVDRRLRRYSRSLPAGTSCSVNGSYHDAQTPLDISLRPADSKFISQDGEWPHDDPRWPKACQCGYEFTPDDHWQLFVESLWKAETGEVYRLRDAPPGAMYDADWMHTYAPWCGADGKSLHVVLPNGQLWFIDGPATNCGSPDDKTHKCWVRHGEAPNLTVDKNGKTCSAGAGSIVSKDYHGFLRDGILTAG